MREVESCRMEYSGYVNPENEEEVALEILGLELAIKTAEQRVAILRQGVQIAKMKRIAEPIRTAEKENPKE